MATAAAAAVRWNLAGLARQHHLETLLMAGGWGHQSAVQPAWTVCGSETRNVTTATTRHLSAPAISACFSCSGRNHSIHACSMTGPCGL
ncbi:unnamed protein product [Symbiodinium microadriaticum]|nr:unnamed protein product [Symbiodinium microadriaticum]CAE7226774.1 unnamed protein product [Symbiodinium sp. KB8]